MSTRITLSRKFAVDGYAVTLAAGEKDARPLVVMGFTSLPYQELANVTIEYPMKSITGANKFVLNADDDVIRRGIAKYEDELDWIASKVNQALLMPYNPHGYATRGMKKKG